MRRPFLSGRGRYAKAALALSVLLAAAAVLFMARGPLRTGDRSPRWTILADTSGGIRLAACLVNSARHASLRNAAAVTNIVNALPGRARILILANDPSAFLVSGDPVEGRVEFLALPSAASFTIWPQDPFVVLTRANRGYMLLASSGFDRDDDRLIVQELADHLGYRRRTSKLSFEGGNITADGEHVYIGADTIRFNALKLELPDMEVARMFEREFGRSVIVLGPQPQPVAHIDMVFTPLGDRRVLIADPDWGADLAGRELEKSPQAIMHFEAACEAYFFGDPGILEIPMEGRASLQPPRMAGATSRAIADSRRIADHLDALADQLVERGFEAHRVPFLFAQGKDDEAGYPCLTYNNVVVEDHPAGRTVYLPRYGLLSLDEAAGGVWRRLGYDVKTVTGLTISAMYGGSLRCCLKVVARDSVRTGL